MKLLFILFAGLLVQAIGQGPDMSTTTVYVTKTTYHTVTVSKGSVSEISATSGPKSAGPSSGPTFLAFSITPSSSAISANHTTEDAIKPSSELKSVITSEVSMLHTIDVTTTMTSTLFDGKVVTSTTVMPTTITSTTMVEVDYTSTSTTHIRMTVTSTAHVTKAKSSCVETGAPTCDMAAMWGLKSAADKVVDMGGWIVVLVALFIAHTAFLAFH